MEFKVSIKCMICKCSFELRPAKLKSRDAIECPNCGQPFPNEIYEDLKTGIEALGRVPSKITLESKQDDVFGNIYGKNFEVDVREIRETIDLITED